MEDQQTQNQAKAAYNATKVKPKDLKVEARVSVRKYDELKNELTETKEMLGQCLEQKTIVSIDAIFSSVVFSVLLMVLIYSMSRNRRK